MDKKAEKLVKEIKEIFCREEILLKQIEEGLEQVKKELQKFLEKETK